MMYGSLTNHFDTNITALYPTATQNEEDDNNGKKRKNVYELMLKKQKLLD